MRRLNHLSVLSCVILLAAITQRADAALITLPPGLNPGDQYRLAFVTTGVRDATSDDIDDYNMFVDNFGDDAIASDWKAIASTPTVSAQNNTNTNPSSDGAGIPIYNLNGDRIANNYIDLWSGSLEAAIRYFQNGGPTPNEHIVWTGTAGVGGDAATNNELGNTRGFPSTRTAAIGFASDSDVAWVNSSIQRQGTNYSLYGLSGVLTVPQPVPAQPVPEPSSAIAMGLLVGIGFAGRRLRRRQPEAA